MDNRVFVWAFFLLAATATQSPAQPSKSTVLVIRMGPESRIIPESVALNFYVAAEGGIDVMTQSAVVEAWGRAAAGQRIRVNASLDTLDGPEGPVPTSAVTFSASPAVATGGGRQASCASGAFSFARPQELILNWYDAGTVACTLKFTLAPTSPLAPGAYRGTIRIAAEAGQ
jgi:hypothetical protein